MEKQIGGGVNYVAVVSNTETGGLQNEKKKGALVVAKATILLILLTAFIYITWFFLVRI
jgi:hypothetical protein